MDIMTFIYMIPYTLYVLLFHFVNMSVLFLCIMAFFILIAFIVHSNKQKALVLFNAFLVLILYINILDRISKYDNILGSISNILNINHTEKDIQQALSKYSYDSNHEYNDLSELHFKITISIFQSVMNSEINQQYSKEIIDKDFNDKSKIEIDDE